MSADRHSTEWHLTPTGWVHGTYAYYGNPQGKPVPRPENALATYEYEVTQASSYKGREEKTFDLIWQKEGVSKEEVTQLRQKFKDPI